MKKYVLFLILLCINIFAFGMSKQNHIGGFHNLWEGIIGDNFEECLEKITDLPDLFSMEEFSKLGLPKAKSPHHRDFGHWGWNDKIPEEILLYAEEHGCSSSAIEQCWRRMQNETIDFVVQKTGLPRKQASAFVSLTYNVHLLEDYATEKIAHLQSPEKITRDIIKRAKILFGKKSKITIELRDELEAIISNKNLNPREKALMASITMTKKKIGETFCKNFSTTFAKKQISFSEKIIHNLDVLKIEEEVLNKNLFSKYFKTLKGVKNIDEKFFVDDMLIKQNAIFDVIEKKGEKAYRIRFAFKKDPEVRALYKFVDEYINKYGEPKTAEQLETFKNILHSHANSSSIRLGSDTSKTAIDKMINDVGAWKHLRANAKTLGLQTGIVTLIFSEGMTVFQFSETDMSEEEFINETLKNAGEASLSTMIMTCSIYLGANPFTWPHGLIIAGIEIGTLAIYNFAFTNIQQYLDSQIFTLDDFLGDLPPEIRDRTTSLSNAAYKEMKRENKKRLNAIEYENRQNALISNPLNIYETHEKENVFTEGKDSGGNLIEIPERENVFTRQKGN